MMTELQRALTADSAHASPVQILRGVDAAVAGTLVAGATHTIYQELWHVCFWQQMTLDWTDGLETASPLSNELSFPGAAQVAAEPWAHVCGRFFAGNAEASRRAGDPAGLARMIGCPSPPGLPMRTMSVEDQLISLAAHNAYHFGRIVLLRQMLHAWPPPGGGFTW